MSSRAAGASAAARGPTTRVMQTGEPAIASEQQRQRQVAKTLAAGEQHRIQERTIAAAPSAAKLLLEEPCPPSITLEGPACFTNHSEGIQICGGPTLAASQGASMPLLACSKQGAEDSTQKSLHAGGDSCGFSSLFSMAATCDGFASNPAMPARPDGMQHADSVDHSSSRLGVKDSRQRSLQAANDTCGLGSLLNMGTTCDGLGGNPGRDARPGSRQNAEAQKDCSPESASKLWVPALSAPPPVRVQAEDATQACVRAVRTSHTHAAADDSAAPVEGAGADTHGSRGGPVRCTPQICM